jgi:hypothetical protein
MLIIGSKICCVCIIIFHAFMFVFINFIYSVLFSYCNWTFGCCVSKLITNNCIYLWGWISTHTLIPLCLHFSVSWRVIVLYLCKMSWFKPHWQYIQEQVIFLNPLALKCKPNWFVFVIFWYVFPFVVCYLLIFLMCLCCLCNLPYDCFSST